MKDTSTSGLSPLAALLLGYVTLAICLQLATDLDLFGGFSVAGIAADVAATTIGAVLMLAVIGFRRRLFGDSVGAAGRVAVAAGIVLGYLVFLDLFLAYKTIIPEVIPFGYWDRVFFTWDRALHGTDPWRLLHPLVGSPLVTNAIDRVYYVWFPVKIAMLAGVALTAPSRLRSRFLFSFFACWILLGTLLAFVFSSAGPCYYASILPGDPYDALFDYLARVDREYGLQALTIQAKLWASYRGIELLDPVAGVSAMPSLHVALPTLYTLWGWNSRRWMGAIFAAFLLVTLIGSVHLGWHYAIDGYVSIVAVFGLWWISGRLYPEEAAPSTEPVGRAEASAASSVAVS